MAAETFRFLSPFDRVALWFYKQSVPFGHEGGVRIIERREYHIVAVTSFGLNALCRGTDFAYRVDRAEVLEWITSH